MEMAAFDDGPLSKLSREEQEALVHLARAGADRQVSRRTLMKVVGAGGLGGLAALVSGRAQADASASDGDGDIGSPSSPVDVFADGVDATSIEGPVAGNNTITDLLGNNLSVTNGVLNAASGGSSANIFASPGNIQSTLDNYQASGSETFGNHDKTEVKLEPDSTYSNTTESLPITVREGTRLNMNGTDLVVNSNTDVFQFEPWSELYNGRIKYDGAGTTYSSSVFKFRPETFGTINTQNPVYMHNVRTIGDYGNGGTVFDMYTDSGVANDAIGMSIFSLIRSRSPGDHFVRMETGPNADGWINGNQFLGCSTYGGEEIFYLHNEPGNTAEVAGNLFDGVFHPSSNETLRLASISGDDSCYAHHWRGPKWDLHRCDTDIVNLSGSVNKNTFWDTLSVNVSGAGWINNNKWVDNTGQTGVNANHWFAVNQVSGAMF